MGLSNHLSDISGGSIPILLISVAAEWLSCLRSLLRPTAAAECITVASSSVAGGLAGLSALADQLSAVRPFRRTGGDDASAAAAVECVVCLCGMRSGDKLRQLACCHLFHSDCLDGWIRGSNPCCPLCRSPVAAEERRATAELLPWLSLLNN